NEIPYYIIGNGTNLLVSDDGFRGIVVVIKEGKADISYVEREEEVLVRAHAGAPLTKVAYDAARRGLAGFEFAAGIPGSVGGAVFMNAGAYGGEIKDVIVSARVMDTEGNIFDMDRDALELSYRHSVIGEKNLIVLEAVFALKRGDTGTILATISELNAKRRDKQPLEYPSAGSTFKRPEGYFAGKLIEEAGLKGYSVGDACVSEKHCGFVINKGRATSSDIIKLIGEVSDRVYRNSGVRLEPEVRMIGFD
ncbi:MAG: UDP-N-acetylmuramate dehydrogenase, partial [Lachnospiraceae bacterium]|nr:UDP-N-acetylmuramate dehydrogenase [Lachnospiraceae bacterium]